MRKTSLYFKQKITNTMTKQAQEAVKSMVKKALDVSDIENEIGTYLDDEYEDKIRSKIDYQKSKRYPLRHPYLTGIPTLGIIPANSKKQAVDEIVTDMARQNSDLRKEIVEAKRHRERRRDGKRLLQALAKQSDSHPGLY